MVVSVVQSLSIRSSFILFQLILQMVSNFVQQMVVKSVRDQNSWKLLKKFQITEPLPESQKEAYEAFLKNAHIDVAAIEWVQSESGDIYVYDVNTNTNYNPTAEQNADIFAHQHLAEYLKRELEALYS